MTVTDCIHCTIEIIPYQELLGNYDLANAVKSEVGIIPYQELLGNYDG